MANESLIGMACVAAGLLLLTATGGMGLVLPLVAIAGLVTWFRKPAPANNGLNGTGGKR
jgi:hypothetical protein